MPRIGNPVRALMRLDDRLLGRWLYNREPLSLRVEIAAVIALVTIFAVLSGKYWLLLFPIPTIAAAWYRYQRTRRNGRPD